MISGRDQSRADDVIQPLSALRHLQTSGSAGLSTFAFRRGIQSCGLSAPLSIISRFRFSTRNMGEDLDLFGLPDSRSSALRAGKDISFGSVSQSSHFKKRRRFANWTDLNFFFFFFQIAGIVSKVFEHPFDLCKVRLQTQVLDQIARFSGPIDCLTKTWKNEGFRGLYRVRVHLAHRRGLVRVLTDYMRYPPFFLGCRVYQLQ